MSESLFNNVAGSWEFERFLRKPFYRTSKVATSVNLMVAFLQLRWKECFKKNYWENNYPEQNMSAGVKSDPSS